jgi:hypothetical protein
MIRTKNLPKTLKLSFICVTILSFRALFNPYKSMIYSLFTSNMLTSRQVKLKIIFIYFAEIRGESDKLKQGERSRLRDAGFVDK